jgi:hypothetical protein
MRIRTILAAAAAPAALAAVLLGTAGQASAATTTQVAHVQLANNPDSGVSGQNWALDNVNRTFTVTPVTGRANTYNVQVTDEGTWNAIAGAPAPLDGSATTAMGSESGHFSGGATFTVFSPNGGASEANLHAALNQPGNGVIKVDYNVTPGVTYSQLVQDLFPQGATVTGSFTSWGWTYNNSNERMTQQSAAPSYTDTPVGLFTNGG